MTMSCLQTIATLIALLLYADARSIPDGPEEKIVGGKDVDPPFKYEFMVKGNGCGASLVSPNVVLSAAHCAGVFNEGSYVEIGRHDILNSTENFERIRIKQAIPHHNYDTSTTNFDYMMLVLDQASTRTPIELDNGEAPVPSLTQGSDVTAIGWGRTSSGGSTSNILQEVTVGVVENNECNEAYGYITDAMLCAARLGKDSCQGDSGGPLVDDATGKLVGVVSFGRGCADPNYPGVYAKVRRAHAWMEGIIHNNALEPTISPAPSDSPTDYPTYSACDDVENHNTLIIEVLTDDYPEETNWVFVNQKGDETESEEYSKTNHKYSHQFCLPDIFYTFTLYDSYKDGFSGDAYLSLTYNGALIWKIDEFRRAARTEFGPTAAPTTSSLPTISPVPSTGAPTLTVCGNNENTLIVDIMTDQDPEQTSWIITGGENPIKSTSYTEAYTLHSLQICLQDNVSYQFIITDNECDGFGYSGFYRLTYNGGIIKEIYGDFGYSDEVDVAPLPLSEPPTSSPTEAPCDDPPNTLIIDVHTDYYASETSWIIEELFTGIEIKSPTYNENNNRYKQQICLPDGDHRFTMYDSFGDGMNFFYDGLYSLTYNGIVIIDSNGQFDKEEVTVFNQESTQPASRCDGRGNTLIVDLVTDAYAHETKWDIVQTRTGQVINSPDTINSSYHSYELCIPDGIHTFTIYDTFGDGLESPLGSYSLTYNGEIIKEYDGTFFAAESTVIGALN